MAWAWACLLFLFKCMSPIVHPSLKKTNTGKWIMQPSLNHSFFSISVTTPHYTPPVSSSIPPPAFFLYSIFFVRLSSFDLSCSFFHVLVLFSFSFVLVSVCMF
ncbi:MAG: hypothetical protein J3R72DRAFT_457249 [Linnemannia gamsii]|nr:MAG: hypothetical protein J3R72DRAFT_457249 [Linnemannia gamsii]